MVILFVAFYLIIFVVYASMYSSTMQDLNTDYRVLKVDGVDTKKIKTRISTRENKVSKLKKDIWLPVLFVFIAHLIAISQTQNSIGRDYLIASLLFGSTIVLVLIINWMKGAGTIDSNPRLPGQTRI